MAKKPADRVKLAASFTFDHKAEAAQAEARKRAAKLVTEISKSTERAIRNVVVSSLNDGVPVYEAARTIRSLVGLTSAQGQANLKYRGTLIDQGLTMERVNKLVDKYADEQLRYRADTIARYEIMDALNAGQDASWQQAQDEGLLTEHAEKEVILAPDACEECTAIAEAGPIPVREEFPGGGPPFHGRCRCTEALTSA